MDKLVLGHVSPLSPFRNDLFSRFQSEFDQFFAEFLNPNRAKRITSRSYPKVDIYRKDRDLIIEAAVPGCCKEDIKIELERDSLTISFDKISKDEESANQYYTRELKQSSWSRTFFLPQDYPEPIASLNQGILQLNFKEVFKDQEPQRKLIDIR